MFPLLAVFVRHRGLVVAASLLLAAAAVSRLVDLETGAPRLLLDPSVNSMLPRADEGRRFYDRVRRIFGSDDTLLAVLVDDDVFSAENLARIVRLTDRFSKVEGVHHVVSLGNALHIRARGEDLLIEPFVSEVPRDPEALAEIRRSALEDPIYAGNLVSRDGRAAAFSIYLLDMSEQEFLESGIEQALATIIEEERGDAEIWLTGNAHVKYELTRLLLVDLLVLVPLAVAVMGVVAFLSFRTLRGVWIPLATVAIALGLSLAFVADVFGSLNQVTVAAPPILIVVGFAYAVHVVAAYYDVLRASSASSSGLRLAQEALRHTWLPVLLTGLTTGAGFASLTTSPLVAIREFGVITAIGVLVMMSVALTFTPAVLALLPPPPRVRAAGADAAFARFLGALADFDMAHRRSILGVGAVVAAVSLYGMSRIVVSTDLVTNFRPDHEVRRHFEAVNQLLEGANSFFVVLETDQRDAFKEPENLRQVKALQEWLEDRSGIGGTTSLVDYLQVINQGFHGDDPLYFEIPSSRRLASQLFFFGGNDELDNFVDSAYRTANILVRSREIDSARVASLVREIEAHLATLPRRFEATVTGNTVLVSRTIDQIALGQALSLSTAFLIIYAILVLLFTSFRIGLLALLPNALSVLVYFGVLGLSGVTLNTVTGLVACLVLGIAVDDTIHLMARFSTEARQAADERRGLREALIAVGRPVTYTTAALCAGFLVLTASQLRNQVEFGALAAVTLAVAWLVDVTFTPALVARVRIVTLWDVLSLDLGEDPHLSIPLFAGLRPRQARTATLLMSMRELSKGERLFENGAPGSDMYVVVDGQLSVTRTGEDGRVALRTLGRGDVVGEIALFKGARTADVDALTDARLVCLTQRDLRRLQIRYPSIAAVIQGNLAANLAERVADLTDRTVAEAGRR